MNNDDDEEQEEEGSYDSDTAVIKRPRRSIRGSKSNKDSAGTSRVRLSRVKKGIAFCFKYSK